jgi:hypothetical protein
MDDVVRVDEREVAPGRPADGDPRPAPDRGGHRALRRVGLALVAALVLGAIGLQVQVHRVDQQAADAEARRRSAQLDATQARERLDSVDARVRSAEAAELRARGTLARSRTAVADQGLEEGALDDVRVATAGKVKELRRGVRSVQRQIEELARLQPAGGACLFDLLRALGQVGGGNRSGPRSEACSTVAATRGPG